MFNIANINRQISESIKKEMDTTAKNIKDNMQLNKQYATGATADSIRTETGSNFGIIWGADHIDTLEKGISPERARMTSFVFAATGINLWQAAKGLNLNKNIVGAITRKQRIDGSILYRTGGRTDVYSNEIQPLLERLKATIGNKLINTKILE